MASQLLSHLSVAHENVTAWPPRPETGRNFRHSTGSPYSGNKPHFLRSYTREHLCPENERSADLARPPENTLPAYCLMNLNRSCPFSQPTTESGSRQYTPQKMKRSSPQKESVMRSRKPPSTLSLGPVWGQEVLRTAGVGCQVIQL